MTSSCQGVSFARLKIAHLITGLHSDPFGIVERVAVRSVAMNNPDWQVIVWCGTVPTGVHWERAIELPNVLVCRVPNHKTWRGNTIPQYAHRSDLVRHALLHDLGGLYLDTDTITLAPFPPEWVQLDTVIGREFCGNETVGLCNAVMYSSRGSQFQKLWLKEWEKFDGKGWNEFSVRLPWKIHLENPGICTVVDRWLLGPMYCELHPCVTIDGLPGVIVCHLWRTYWRRLFESFTEDFILRSNNTYSTYARQYL